MTYPANVIFWFVIGSVVLFSIWFVVNKTWPEDDFDEEYDYLGLGTSYNVPKAPVYMSSWSKENMWELNEGELDLWYADQGLEGLDDDQGYYMWSATVDVPVSNIDYVKRWWAL